MMPNSPIDENRINEYFEKLTKGQIKDFLRENHFEEIRSSCLDEAAQELVKLMIDCDIFEVKQVNEILIEHGKKSCFYINILEIIEQSRGDELHSLLGNFIKSSINDTEYTRVVGLLCNRGGDNSNLSRENYSLAPVTASKVGKPPYELIFQEHARADEPMFLRHGKTRQHEKVILIDEMITTGANLKRAIKFLREEENVEVSDAFVLMSRTSESNIADVRRTLNDDFKVNLHCILTIEKLLEALLQADKITLEGYERVKQEIQPKSLN
jgi:orotate phosphoribosyltransferase